MARQPYRWKSRCRNKRPADYLKVIASLVPKDLNLNVDVVTRLADMRPEELAAMRRVLSEQLARAEGRVIEHEPAESVPTPEPQPVALDAAQVEPTAAPTP